ncbi:MAG TPA: DUF481 domain-containing protein [Polyangia bacterium]|jgi:hypothetical protein
MVRAVAVAALLCVGSVARAQIFNVQPLLDQQTHAGFSGAVEGALDWHTGNTTLTLVSGSAHLQWHRDPQLVYLALHAELGTTAGVEAVSKDLEHLRYRIRLTRVVAAEAFVQHDADAFRRLAVRAVTGAGVRLRIVEGKRVTFAVAAAYMLEYERLALGMFADSGAATLDHRLSTYAVVAVTAKHVLIAHTVYAQPRFDDFHDVRMLGDSSLSLIVTKHLSVKFSVTITLDTEPPDGVLPVDTDVKSSLVGSF